MNIRFLSNRLRDSSPTVQDEIAQTTALLDEHGIDYETQDIGEPDSAYLSYLKELLPPVTDNKVIKTATVSDSKFYGSFSELFSNIEFDYSESDIDWEFDTWSERDHTGELYQESVVIDIEAGDYLVKLYMSEATMTFEGKEDYDPGDYYTPPAGSIDIVDHYFGGRIDGLCVFKGDVPVLFIEGAFSAQDFIDGHCDYAGSFEFLENSDIDIRTVTGLEGSAMFKGVDSALESVIGSVSYKQVL